MDSRRATGASGVNIKAWAGKLEEVVDSSIGKSSLASWHAIGADVLTSVQLSPIIACLTMIGSNALEVCRGGPVGRVACHFERFVISVCRKL